MIRFIFIFVMAMVSSFLVFFPADSSAKTKRALLIGISDYSDTDYPPLAGPRNDLELAESVLKNRFNFKDIVILKDSQATHTGLENAFASLAKRTLSGDILYIHYSGHGSYTQDLNGDESSGLDQTWVSYGARANQGDSKNPDNYDVLDDELNQWIEKIYAKTDSVVFVSDSCHSATVSRGATPAVRSLPIDKRSHIRGNIPFKPVKLKAGLMIGASRDDESASEFKARDGKDYGVWTWYWFKALQDIHPGATWNEVFQKASAMIRSEEASSQHPQMWGQTDREVFGSHFQPLSKTVPILHVKEDGVTVTIKAGSLSGVTEGSTYRLHEKSESPALLEIISVKTMESIGKIIKGNFKQGDLVIEESHVYLFEPFHVFINADYKESHDQKIYKAITEALTELTAYRLTDDQRQSDIVLYILRPKLEKNKPVYIPGNTLPKSFPEQPPEVWILNNHEQLIRKELQISFNNPEKGLNILKENLRIFARVHEIKTLGISDRRQSPVILSVHHLLPDPDCKKDSECFSLPQNLGNYKIKKTYSQEEVKNLQVKKRELLAFSLKNPSRQDYYCYLLDIMPDGNISMIFPQPGTPDQIALIRARSEFHLLRDANIVGLMMDAPGQETIKLIATRSPFDVRLLEEKGYLEARGKEELNPLEKLLSNAVQGKRGTSRMINDEWGCFQFDVEVK